MPRTPFDMVATLVGTDPRDTLTRELDQANTAYTAMKMPAPLYYQPNNAGHEDARLVGRIDSFTIEVGRVRAAGEMFDGEDDERNTPRIAEDAREAVHMGREGMVTPSIDPTVLAVGIGEDGRMALTHADISGVTLVGMPAMVGTSITFPPPAEAGDVEAALAMATGAPTPTPSEVEYLVNEDGVEGSLAALVAAGEDRAEGEAALAALVAAVNEPAPAAAFAKPDTSRYDPGFRIEGRRIYGQLAALDACHLNWPDQCVTPPPSPSGYALFSRYSLATDAGELPVGRLTSGLGRVGNGCSCCDPGILDDHACPNRMGLVAAMNHHDRMPTLADVVIGEDDGVIWLAGLLRPNLGADEQAVLARRVWSGDWRPAGEADELVEVLALHHGKPGFAMRVKTSRTRSVLVAAAGPIERAPAETRDIDAIVAQHVRGYAALTDLTASLSLAEQAQARAQLARLETSA